MDVTEIADHLAFEAYCVVPEFVSGEVLRGLRADFEAARAAGGFRPAAVGRGTSERHEQSIRRDTICWWEPGSLRPDQADLWERWETLRLAVNRELVLGAWSLEAHYAHYPPGAFYARHLDRFADDDKRVLSLVLYLNEAWEEGDGGELRLFLPTEVRVVPRGGTLVAFLSDRVPHEVAPTARDRRSIAGWFRRR